MPNLLPLKKERKNTIKTMVGYHGINEEQAERIDALLLGGTAPYQIATMIQDEWKLATTISRIAVLQRLITYRNNRLGKNIILAASRFSPKDKPKIVESLNHDLNTLGELVEIVQTQKGRLQQMLKHETKKGISTNQTTANLKMLADVLLKIAELQMELGLLRRVPKKVNVEHDVTKEEQEFIENAQLATTNTEVLTDALRYLKDAGVLALPQETAVQ